ncbi:MAG: hypothetical protein APR63_14880 [Desulfuromonas sp. SDB]|nr:MAG: hypothetical protein APR63_14880 [Desulfuromonas sp. SDB]
MASSLKYMKKNERSAIERFREAIKKNLGKDLISIIAFGSKVRGDYNETSDIDILIIVKDRSLRIMDKIAEITSELNIKYNISIAPVVFSEKEYDVNKVMNTSFTSSISAEGLSL